MDKVQEKVLQILECFVCFEIMSDGTTMCEIGHTMCKSCGKKVDLCPICHAEMSTMKRNVAIEEFIKLYLMDPEGALKNGLKIGSAGQNGKRLSTDSTNQKPPKTPEATAAKRGRGRPKGSKNKK